MIKIKKITGFPKYQIDTNGNVFSFSKSKKGQMLKKTIGNHGYVVVSLFQNKVCYKRLAHRLVLQEFIGECPKNCETRHINGNRTNNRLKNLAWGTHEENDKDKVIHGKMPTSLSQKDVAEIREKYALGKCTQQNLASDFGVGQDQISRIINYKRWATI